MRVSYLILLLIMTVIPGLSDRGNAAQLALQQPGVTGEIDWPVTGELIQGTVVVRGSTPADGLRNYEVDYALSSDPNQAWALIQEGTTPVQDGILAVWDTTPLPDGEYNLRLLVNLTNGHQSVTNMYNLHVQNEAASLPTSPPATAWYLDLEVKTPTPTPPPAIDQTTPAVFLSTTSTPLPKNPVEITSSRAIQALGGGAALSITIFIVLGGYFGIRHFIYRK
jgi:hypothetical protein